LPRYVYSIFTVGGKDAAPVWSPCWYSCRDRHDPGSCRDTTCVLVIMKRVLLIIGVTLPVLIAASLLAYQIVSSDPKNVRLPIVEGCALHLESCAVSLPAGAEVVFEIDPKQPNSNNVLQLAARFRGVDPQSVGVRFKGVNMDMGNLEDFIQELARQESPGEAVLFSGPGSLFVCSRGVMRWLVLVEVKIDKTYYEIPFRFESNSV